MIDRRLKAVLRFVPLALFAVVLVREKPWTVRLSASAPWAVGASILLNFVVFLPLKAARWRIALVQPPPFWRVLAATIEGLLANAAIGFGSGDLVRAARLRPQAGDLAVDYASTWAERGAEAFALALLVLASALVARLGPLALTLARSGSPATSRCSPRAARSSRASAGGRACSARCRLDCRRRRPGGWRRWRRCRCSAGRPSSSC